MTGPPRELIAFLYRYPPAIQSLALGLRQVVHAEMAPCHGYVFEMRSKVVLLYSTTERVISDGVCSINVFAKHVTLGFTHGTDLEDAGGILQGTGKALRHVRLLTLADLDRPELRRCLRQARSLAGPRPLRRRATRWSHASRRGSRRRDGQAGLSSSE